MRELLRDLNRVRPNLTRQEYRTIRGQLAAGDSDGARRGLLRVLRRRWRDAES